MTLLFWIVFVVLTLVYSVLFSRILKNIFLASVVTACALAGSMQLIDWFIRGYLDEFFLIAITISFIVSLALSLAFLFSLYFYKAKRKAS